jgi:lipopolysaccharide heptosyltransferase II
MKRFQAVDKVLGLVICAALQPLRLVRRLRRRPSNGDVLAIKFWGLGSVQLLTPAVAALRRRHPGARIDLLTLTENEVFARDLGVFDEVLALDVSTHRWSQVFRRIVSLARELRRRRFRAVYDFEFFTRFSAVVSWLSGAPDSFGFMAPDVWRGRLHANTVPFNRYWHVSRNFRCLAGGENGSEVSWRDLTAFRHSAADAQRVGDLLSSAGPDAPLAVLNPNAGSLSLERRWPQPYFAALASRLAREDGMRVALVGSAAEIEWTSEVAARVGTVSPGSLVNLAGRLSLSELHALFARAELFVSNDSGPMHLAAATGTPTLGLFGPETPVMYAPLGPRVRALYAPPPCSPCINVHDNKVANCYRGRPECLINLTPEHVLAEARALRARAAMRLAAHVGDETGVVEGVGT